MTNIERAELAMYHYYLVEAILDNAPEDFCVGDLFGIGEDCFICALFPFSEAFYRLYDEAYQKDNEIIQTVIVYEVPAVIAEWFWNEIQNQKAELMDNHMPCLKDFEQMLNKVIYK